MTDVGFVLAGWGVIVGGLALYAVTLLRRLRAAGHEATGLREAVDDGVGAGTAE